MLPQAVSEHYRAQQRLIVAALGLVRREWSKMGDDFDASWVNIAPRVELLTASAQLGAARNGASYVPRVLDEYGESIDPLAEVMPEAFAGIASDGRPLGSLLEGGKIQAKRMNSLEAGGKWLDMAVHTQIADASRGAAAVAIAARPGVGWVRMVNPPCCGPCAVLAGREYRFNAGFKRHPRCDCMHIPTTLANPGDHFGVSPALDQIHDLTEGERQALLAGGDLSRVINARRGGGLGKMSTTEIAKRGQRRLTPDGVFAQARDRDEALELLRLHGYITPTGRRVAAITSAPAVPVVSKAGAEALREVVGELVGATDDLVPERLEEAAETLRGLTSRYGVPVHRFEIGNTASQGKFGALGDAGRGGTMNITRKAFSAKWEAWERVTARAAEHATVTSSHSQLVNTLTHEYGHLIDFATGEKLSVGRIQKALARELGITGSDYDLWLSREMSLYARSKRVEAVAEAFADVELNGEGATELSKRIHAELIRLLRNVQDT